MNPWSCEKGGITGSGYARPPGRPLPVAPGLSAVRKALDGTVLFKRINKPGHTGDFERNGAVFAGFIETFQAPDAVIGVGAFVEFDTHGAIPVTCLTFRAFDRVMDESERAVFVE